MTTYNFTYTTDTTNDEIRIDLTWQDEAGATICSGSAVVSRAPEEYAPILAAAVRDSIRTCSSRMM